MILNSEPRAKGGPWNYTDLGLCSQHSCVILKTHQETSDASINTSVLELDISVHNTCGSTVQHGET